MHRKRVHPALIRDRIKATGSRAPRRVHKNIETAKILHHLLHAIAASVGIGNVSFHKPGFRPMRIDCCKKILW
jgi:hypothetical protein